MKECQILIWLAVVIAAAGVTGLFVLLHHLTKD